MKLIVAVVRDQDANRLIDALVTREYRATRINTAGGFLKRGNATVLIGVADDQVDDVVDVARSACRSRGAEAASSVEGDGIGVLFVLPVVASCRV